MAWVNMTVFITHCWKSVQFELNGRGRTGFGLRALCVLIGLWVAAFMPAMATAHPFIIPSMLVRTMAFLMWGCTGGWTKRVY